MISKSEFDFLTMLKENPEIDENKYFSQIRMLLSDKIIQHNVTGEDHSHIFYKGYKITLKGERAYEEYKNFLESEARKTETLAVAKEANDIAKKANKKSSVANWIAIAAAIFSLGMLIVTILK